MAGDVYAAARSANLLKETPTDAVCESLSRRRSLTFFESEY